MSGIITLVLLLFGKSQKKNDTEINYLDLLIPGLQREFVAQEGW
jgi:hypothetical protein